MKNLPFAEPEKKPLYLPMQKVWFDEIETGKKKEEYREGTNHYKSRFFKSDKNGNPIAIRNYSTVLLQEGYNPGARRMLIEVNSIQYDGDFTIFLGAIIERLNFDRSSAPKRKPSSKARHPGEARKKAKTTIEKMLSRRLKRSRRT
ncbi:hypothetical protein [Chryseobacterium sp.]|uniref:hypothetical protein n=1 Tax=Chryseobacterium sp. TaxID=1871047 RepID=UPI0026113E41|nr:hypothetical protein [Chryseobacterium sp.]